MQDHHEQRDVHGASADGERVPIAADARERSLPACDREHLGGSIEGHDRVGRLQEGREPPGPRSQVEHSFSRLDLADLDQALKPEGPIGEVVRSDCVVVRGASRIVDRHATCKWPTAYQSDGNST